MTICTTCLQEVREAERCGCGPDLRALCGAVDGAIAELLLIRQRLRAPKAPGFGAALAQHLEGAGAELIRTSEIVEGL